MDGINNYLEKIKKILLSKDIEINAIKQSIYEATKVEIKDKEIKNRKGQYYLDTSPIYKIEILLNKEKINKRIKEISGKDISIS